MWPPSGMSLQIILFGKIIHRTVELDMSSLVKVLVLTDQERGKCRPNSLSVDDASKNRSSTSVECATTLHYSIAT